MIIIGTAGHIDHGKSAIVKRLTGTDPDRLPEEKKRGLTIDLGFAFRKTHDGSDIGFVDVPGHERFVKNMIAGAGGIDAVMLVIAADDGWMPQSQEHFQITRLLGITRGFIVINKVDLVEKDWLTLLTDDVRSKVRGSFLDGAPLFHVSAETGQGIDELADFIAEFAAKIETRKDYGKARLYIDRSFVRPGMGGVVTGTLKGGSLSVGQSVLVWPVRKVGKVRTLQSRHEDVQTALPGSRTAVSFTGIERDDLPRGGVVTDRTDVRYFVDHPILALSLELLAEAPVAVEDRRRALLLVGTTEIEGEVRIFESEQLSPGQHGIVFFEPEEPVYTLIGDHFILRLPTPMETLGGGVVLDHLERFPRRKELPEFAYLKDRLSMAPAELVRSEMRKRVIAHSRELLHEADFDDAVIQATVNRLIDGGHLEQFRDFIMEPERLQEVVTAVEDHMARALEDSPHLKGLPPDRIAETTPLPSDAVPVLLDYMVDKGLLSRTTDVYNLAGRSMELKGVIKEAHDRMMQQLEAERYAPPNLSELASGGKHNQQAIKYMLDTGEVYKVGTDFLFPTDVWDDITTYIREKLTADEKLAVADLREQFGFTRKYVIPILEETDRIGLTERQGDIRVKGKNFEA